MYSLFYKFDFLLIDALQLTFFHGLWDIVGKNFSTVNGCIKETDQDLTESQGKQKRKSENSDTEKERHI